MRAFHHSRLAEYRTPFGAVQVGGTVTVALDIWDNSGCYCALRTWIDGVGETLIPMRSTHEGDAVRYTATVPAEYLGNIWYCFIIRTSEGDEYFYGTQEGRTGGEGRLYREMPPSFQITVYKERSIKPDWYREGLVYQIFPDRFKRGKGWEERFRSILGKRRFGITRALQEDWNAPPTYAKDERGRVIRWDFYGGDLDGIREELPRLAEMGVTVLYLNPIFSAASNHRYDTADYLLIEPLLGGEEAFTRLVAEGERLGISLILDGVFNHTGADSRYFDKFGNYQDVGAWQSPDSPYFSWFKMNQDGSYNCWWGVDDLPDTDKNSEGWQQFVYGPGGVVEYWTSRGARGWRLDVADELNDQFIAGIRDAELRVRPDGLLLGEVWEDASNKIAYGEKRHYLNGDELDSVMNYPFREALLHFLAGEWPASEMAERMATLQENYPPDAFYETLNLIGSHDRARVFTILGGAPDEANLTEAEKRDFRLNDAGRGLAKGRLWLAVLTQMCSPGVPCIYYGDEAGAEGYTDPYNRRPYPWGSEDADVQTIYRNAIALRQRFEVLVSGGFEPFSEGDDIYGFWRTGERESICVLVNRSLSATYEVRLPTRGTLVDELVVGKTVEVEDGEAIAWLYPLGSAVLYFHEPEDAFVKPAERGSGVVCHITSIPNQGKPGTLGSPARRFVDYLARTGQKYWQVLPVTIPDAFGSPYAGVSAFAGNTDLIDTGGKTLKELYYEFQPDDEFATFIVLNEEWLVPYAVFMALKDRMGHDVPWQQWYEEFHHFEDRMRYDRQLRNGVKFHEFCQYLFALQWEELRNYANLRGIKIIGDLPIYVCEDSVDTWTWPELFKLDERGYATEVAGTPPDAFAENGQLWNNPLYDWNAMAADGYDWWMKRLRRAFELYDLVRMDHFLGFEHYYAIERGKSAGEGRWLKGPGTRLFQRAHDLFGPLPIIAEDLGSITPAIRALVAQCGFPAMDVLVFADGDARQGYHPVPHKVVYTSTHDTDTLVGWVMNRFGEDETRAKETAARLIEEALSSDNRLVMMTLQDVLRLGSGARMNVPGTAGNNWKWQATWEEIDGSAGFLATLTRQTARW